MYGDRTTDGLLAFVEPHPLGSESSAAATAADLVLLVATAADFPTVGGLVSIDGAATVAFDSVAINDDGRSGTLGIPDGLPVDVPVGVVVALWDSYGPVVEFDAGVIFPGSDGPARVSMPPELIDLFPVGTRSAADQETVTLERDTQGVWWVKRPAPGMVIRRNANYIADGTLPAVAVDMADFAESAIVVQILNSTNSVVQPVQNLRMQSGPGPSFPFRLNADGTGTWDGLQSVPPVIVALIAALPPSGIDGGVL